MGTDETNSMESLKVGTDETNSIESLIVKDCYCVSFFHCYCVSFFHCYCVSFLRLSKVCEVWYTSTQTGPSPYKKLPFDGGVLYCNLGTKNDETMKGESGESLRIGNNPLVVKSLRLG